LEGRMMALPFNGDNNGLNDHADRVPASSSRMTTERRTKKMEA
jgi:hypothetical protein